VHYASSLRRRNRNIERRIRGKKQQREDSVACWHHILSDFWLSNNTFALKMLTSRATEGELMLYSFGRS